MIDIHSHILPGVDDGAASIEDAVEMARLAVSGGTTVMFATPHILTLRDLARAGEIAQWVATLQERLQTEGIALRLVRGAEVYPMPEIEQALENGAPITLAAQGKYLLLDLPLMTLPRDLKSLIYSLQTRALKVILAHPERVEPIQRDPQCLEDLVRQGVLLQINAASVLGKNGPIAESCAATLLRHRWVHFVASDTHAATFRRPGLARVVSELIASVGAEAASDLLEHNGRRILENADISSNPLPYTPEKKRSGWLGWLKKSKE